MPWRRNYTVRFVVGETHESLNALERRFALTLTGRPLPGLVNPFAIAGGFARAGFLTVRGVQVADAGLEIAFGPHANVYAIDTLISLRRTCRS
jgi:hypothetical protein